MMIKRPADQRGHTNHGWLNSFHTFTFGSYYDTEHMGLSNLRVINDDTVAPGRGFATHGHQDMEIVSVVLDGALEHQDSMGNGSVIRPGDIQRMSAGSGVTHSEYNHCQQTPVHFLQIWLLPNTKGVLPGYEQRHFPIQDRQGKWILLISPDGRKGSIASHQDADLYGTLLDGSDTLDYTLSPDRTAYIHLAKGNVTVNGCELSAGDGLTIHAEPLIHLTKGDHAEILLFDLA